MTREPVEHEEYTATVRAADGVRFTVSAGSAAERALRLVDYVRERCEHTLWPSAADEVRSRIAAGDAEGAIAAYFANVGERWDEEWLELARADRDDAARRWRRRADRQRRDVA